MQSNGGGVACPSAAQSQGDDLCNSWAETGGPEIAQPPDMSGYGSKLIDQSMTRQFRGSRHYDWQRTGLVVTLKMRKDRLAA